MSGEMFSGTIGEMELVERHILMLKATKENQPVGIIRLSELLGIPKHKVRYSLRLLERDGLIMATQEGARVTEKYDNYMKDVESKLDDIVRMVERLKKELP
jgi:predicted transcriptional regulator